MPQIRLGGGQAAAEIMTVDDPAEVFAHMFAFRDHGADETVQSGNADAASARMSVIIVIADMIEIISIVEDADPDQFGIVFRIHKKLSFPCLFCSVICGMILKSFHTRNISNLNIARFFQKSSAFVKKRRDN